MGTHTRREAHLISTARSSTPAPATLAGAAPAPPSPVPAPVPVLEDAPCSSACVERMRKTLRARLRACVRLEASSNSAPNSSGPARSSSTEKKCDQPLPDSASTGRESGSAGAVVVVPLIEPMLTAVGRSSALLLRHVLRIFVAVGPLLRDRMAARAAETSTRSAVWAECASCARCS